MNSLRRVRAIAEVTLVDALRMRTLQVIVLFAFVVIWGGNYFSQLAIGERIQYVKDFGAGAIHLFGLIIIVLLAGQTIPQELENRTLHTLFARPVRVWEYFCGKFFGLMTLSALITVMMGGMLWAQIRWLEAGMVEKGTPEMIGWVWEQTRNYHWVGAVALVYVRFWIVGAIGLMISAFATSQVFTVACTVLIYLAASMLGNAQEAVASIGASDQLQYLFVKALTWLLPDLEAFRVIDDLLAGHAVSSGYVGMLCGYTVVYSGLALLIGTLIFSRREI